MSPIHRRASVVPVLVSSVLVLVSGAAVLLGQTQPAAPPAVVAGIPVNYDEALTGTYTLPDPLVLADGTPVRDAKTWTTRRRPEILRVFEEQQFGRSPGRPAGLRFDVFDKGTPALNGTAIRRQVTIVFSPDPGAPKADLLIYLPANARGPVPLLLNLSFSANSAVVDDPGIKPGEVWDREKNARVPAVARPQGRLNIAPFLAQGIGVATMYYGDIEPDFAEGFPFGVRKHFLKPGQTQPAPDEWGTIAAWGWGLSRAMDYLETDKAVDAKRVAIVGISRLGKTVLWAGARDTRFAMVIASCSGESGAALSRRTYGETVKHMTARYGYQFAANYARYGDRVDTLPVDAHMLIASIAPRPLLLQTGDKDFWSDPKGELLAAVAAGPVYTLLGKEALGTNQMPPAGTPIFHTLGYVMHDGGHGTIPSDWDLFLQFMQRHFQPTAPARPSAVRPSAASADTTEDQRIGREILKELIETDTTHATGSTTVAAERLAARLVAAGFPREDVQVVGGADRKKNFVARYRGKANSVRKPILFLAHLDVVAARREDWSIDPFTLTERDGFFYGRGTQDVKGGAATVVTALLRLRREGFVPNRDLIVALTADEEGGTDNGVQWLLANRRDLIDAAYCINVDSGGAERRKDKLVALDVQAAEKVYISYTLTVKNPGGHSSLPTKDNAISRLAAGLQRLAAFEFPARTNEITRGYFLRMADLESGVLASDMRAVSKQPLDETAAARLSAASPFNNALLRTTCVPTLLQAGHAENALPQTAQATVNCRMLPDEAPASVQETLTRVIADPEIAIAAIAPPVPSPPSPLTPDVLTALETVSRAIWGNVPIVPFMEMGATDGLFLRNAGMPVYAVTGIAYDVDDVRSHGKDERILVRSFYEGIDFIARLAMALASPAPTRGGSLSR